MQKPELSVIIPGLNEEFMQETVTNILENSGPRTEVICVLDGYWPPKGIISHDRLRVIHNEKPIGQRQATNQGAKLSEAKFIMKLDAHCAVSKGFDEELMSSCEYDWTMIPRMYTLDAFHWHCKDCDREYPQGPVIEICPGCGSKNMHKKIVFRRKDHKRTDYMWINDELRMKYFDRPGLEQYGDVRELKRTKSHKAAPWADGDITDVMTCIGAGFFMHRERYWDLGGMDESHGSWGQMAVELSMKAWLSGGRMVVNKRCWFAHLSRTQKGFGFPYSHKPGAIEHARKHSRNMWLKNKWPQAKYTYDWLIKKFSPLPGWESEQKGSWDIEPPKSHAPRSDKSSANKTEKRRAREEEIKLNENKKSISQAKEKSIELVEEKKPENIHIQEITKGVIYYTDNRCEERILKVVRNQLGRCLKPKGIHTISVSHFPISFGDNYVVEDPRSKLTMFKQILIGLEESRAEVIFLAEHDVLYHPSHFDFVPPRDDVYYFNKNVWKVDSASGKCLYYLSGKVSQLCANRELLIDHYRKKIKMVEENGWNPRIGYEPGNRKVKRGGVDDFGREYWESKYPSIDIRHSSNLSPSRFKKSQFRKEPVDWNESDTIPFWGKMTDGGFDNLVEKIMRGRIDYE